MNIAAVVGVWRFARSIDESAGRVVLLGAMALVAFGDPASLRSWWNPSVGLIVTFTLVIVAGAHLSAEPGPRSLSFRSPPCDPVTCRIRRRHDSGRRFRACVDGVATQRQGA